MAADSLRIGSVLITGSSRGIGLEFVKQLTQLAHAPKHIFATCRNPDTARDLQKIVRTNHNVHVHKLDILDYESYPTIVEWVEKSLGSEDVLNVLINNVGIGLTESFSLENVTRDAMMTGIETNAAAPFMITKAFLPLLKKAAASVPDAGLSVSRAAIINITSRMGSIADNGSGGGYPYRTSKVSMNMMTKSLSVDMKPHGILLAAIHPGWVKTDMGGDNALITVEQSVGGMIKVMEQLTEEKTGCFIAFSGDLIPW